MQSEKAKPDKPITKHPYPVQGKITDPERDLAQRNNWKTKGTEKTLILIMIHHLTVKHLWTWRMKSNKLEEVLRWKRSKICQIFHCMFENDSVMGLFSNSLSSTIDKKLEPVHTDHWRKHSQRWKNGTVWKEARNNREESWWIWTRDKRE